MPDPLSISAVGSQKVDTAKWKKLTVQEILKEKSRGEEVPSEIVAWAEQMAALAKAPDDVTYEQVDGDSGLEALEKLGIPAEETGLEENADTPTEVEEPDAVKDPARAEETDEEPDDNIFAAVPTPGQAADSEKPTEKEEEDKTLTLADTNITANNETIRKRRARRGIVD